MCCCSSKSRTGGQATVEAAFLIPVTLLLLALMVQPAIVLYDRMVMEAAAGQGLRMLSTRPSGYPDTAYRQAIENQLEAVPDAPAFHVGEWRIELQGDEDAGEVNVSVETSVRPLPLLGVVAAAFGETDDAGNIVVHVEATSALQPSWVLSQGTSPSQWPGQWG